MVRSKENQQWHPLIKMIVNSGHLIIDISSSISSWWIAYISTWSGHVCVRVCGDILFLSFGFLLLFLLFFLFLFLSQFFTLLIPLPIYFLRLSLMYIFFSISDLLIFSPCRRTWLKRSWMVQTETLSYFDWNPPTPKFIQ